MSDMIVRLATKEDARPVLDIRNDPMTRVQSVQNQELISLSEHLLWFEQQYFGDAKSRCFVLDDNGKVIGYCRYDLGANDEYTVSIAISPEYHGRGLGHLLLSQSIIQFPAGKSIIAEVKKGNMPSIRLFQKNKFQTYREDRNNYYIRYEPR